MFAQFPKQQLQSYFFYSCDCPRPLMSRCGEIRKKEYLQIVNSSNDDKCCGWAAGRRRQNLAWIWISQHLNRKRCPCAKWPLEQLCVHSQPFSTFRECWEIRWETFCTTQPSTTQLTKILLSKALTMLNPQPWRIWRGCSYNSLVSRICLLRYFWCKSQKRPGPVITVSGNKVDVRASHFRYFVRSGLGAPYLSMPRRQSMLLVFEFARLVPFVTPNVVGFFLANPQSTFRIRKVKLVQKCPKKKLPAAPKFIYGSK